MVTRPSLEIGRYDVAFHNKSEQNTKRVEVMEKTINKKIEVSLDGLSNLNYKLVNIIHEHLYTHIKANVLMKKHEYNSTSVKIQN